jgi:hypothetical protein
MEHMMLVGVPLSLMNGVLPMRGNLGGPGGNFLGFLELKYAQVKMTETNRTMKVHISRRFVPYCTRSLLSG